MPEANLIASIPPADGSCLFWRLPPELRNMIYYYVFTPETDCRLYIDTSVSTTKLMIADDDSSEHRKRVYLNPLKNVCRQLRAETMGLEFQHNVLYTDSYDPTTEQSPFFTFVQKLSHCEISMIRRVEVDVVNYVPEKRWNFYFALQRENLIRSRMAWLQTKLARNVRTGCNTSSPERRTLYNFCASYPAATVMLRIPFHNLDPPPFFPTPEDVARGGRQTMPQALERLISTMPPALEGLFSPQNCIAHILLIQLVFPCSGRRLTSLVPSEKMRLAEDVQFISMQEDLFPTGVQLVNLRYFPSTRFNEEEVRRTLQRLSVNHHNLSPSGEHLYNPDEIEERVAWLKELFEEGI